MSIYQNRKSLKRVGLLIILSSNLFFGCESFVDVEPPSTQINSLNVFNQNGTAISAVTEMYGKLVSNTGNSVSSITLAAALSADELSLFNGVTNLSQIAYYRNDLMANAASDFGGGLWTIFYQGILSSNASLEGLNASSNLSPVVKKQLIGECYFMRAFYYFHLVNLYGDAPLVLTTDPNINNSLARSPKFRIYEQIVSDLLQSKELLNQTYVNKDMLPYTINQERIRPNKSAATALLARVYLYMGNNDLNSETAATEVINKTELYGLLALNDVFLKNSKEAIWQLQPVRSGRNTDNGFMFILPGAGPNATGGVNGNPVYLKDSFVASFEPGDARSTLGNWINRITTTGGITYYYPFKYKVKGVSNVTEYEMVLRLGEQYLIRAEARARQGKLTGLNSAASDLNIIRERAGLPPTKETTQSALLQAILNERRSELFTEWGHRWLDIKRADKVDEVMNTACLEKGGTWRSYQQLYPIKFLDIQRGSNLIQNPGYN